MKAIKDCEWKVAIIHDLDWWGWYAENGKSQICGLKGLPKSTPQSAKRNWERFAKINKIKKWKYI